MGPLRSIFLLCPNFMNQSKNDLFSPFHPQFGEFGWPGSDRTRETKKSQTASTNTHANTVETMRRRSQPVNNQPQSSAHHYVSNYGLLDTQDVMVRDDRNRAKVSIFLAASWVSFFGAYFCADESWWKANFVLGLDSSLLQRTYKLSTLWLLMSLSS